MSKWFARLQHDGLGGAAARVGSGAASGAGKLSHRSMASLHECRRSCAGTRRFSRPAPIDARFLILRESGCSVCVSVIEDRDEAI